MMMTVVALLAKSFTFTIKTLPKKKKKNVQLTYTYILIYNHEYSGFTMAPELNTLMSFIFLQIVLKYIARLLKTFPAIQDKLAS